MHKLFFLYFVAEEKYLERKERERKCLGIYITIIKKLMLHLFKFVAQLKIFKGNLEAKGIFLLFKNITIERLN